MLRLLSAATVTFGLLENTVHATSPGQHGDQQGKGPLRCSCEFLLNLQTLTVPSRALIYQLKWEKKTKKQKTKNPDDSVKVSVREDRNEE